jgi:hypothetical protein
MALRPTKWRTCSRPWAGRGRRRPPTAAPAAASGELHGTKGEGRWKALAIGDRVSWRSVTEGTDRPDRQLVEVSIAATTPHEVDWTGPTSTTAAVGTTVSVSAGAKEPNALLHADLRGRLCATFALFLSKYPDVRVSVDGSGLDPSHLQTRRHTVDLKAGGDLGPATLTIIEWSIGIERVLCLCDANHATLDQTEVGIHASGFSFTAYISWQGFRVHEDLLGLANLGPPEIAPVIEEARDAVRQYFRDRREEEQRSTLDGWRDEDVYPYKEEPTEPAEQATQAIFNYVAVAAASAVNSINNAQAKRLSLETIRVAVETDPRSLERIIQEVLKLPQAKVDEFHELLRKTSLTAMLSATKLVTQRLDMLAGLNHLLFSPEAQKTVLETAHLHRILEGAAWLFGEEFALHVSDQTLTTLLIRHLDLLERSDLFDNSPVTDAEGGDRRIDFMFGRALELNQNVREHLVVEIKRPSLRVGRKEVGQIEDYARAVAGDSRFERESTRWEFVLLGVEFKPEAEERRRQAGKPRGLISDPEGGNFRVWLRTWGEVLTECEHRMKFIRRELSYDPTSDEALAFLRSTYPDSLPEALRNRSLPSGRASVGRPGAS